MRTAARIGVGFFFGVVLGAALSASVFADELVTSEGQTLTVTVVKVTEAGVVAKGDKGEKTYAWDDLKAPCAYEFYKRLFPKPDAAAHIKLGKFCIKRKLWQDARAELLEARKLDPTVENEVNKIWAEAVAGLKPEDVGAKGDEAGDDVPSADETRKIIEAQLAKNADVTRATGQKVFSFESEHFVIHTTFPPGDHALMKDLCEKLYKGFDRIFQIQAGKDRMWDGKCMAFLFKDRDGFVKFSNIVDNFPGGSAGGYFRAVGRQCEIVIPNLGGMIDRFKETMVHEGTHAFLHFYRSPGRVPRWVQEGTAQYYEFSEFPKSSMLMRMNQTVVDQVRQGKGIGISPLEQSDRPMLGTDLDGYAWCYTYVSYLIHVDAKKYAEFIRAMKSGLEPEDALKKAYGWDYAELQKQYVKAVAHIRG